MGIRKRLASRTRKGSFVLKRRDQADNADTTEKIFKARNGVKSVPDASMLVCTSSLHAGWPRPTRQIGQSMCHQKRNRRLVHEIVGDAAEQPLAQPRMAVSAHDDQVALSPFSLRNQPGSNLAVVALDVMQGGIDAMMLEMIDGIGTHQLRLRLLAAQSPPRPSLHGPRVETACFQSRLGRPPGCHSRQ